MVELAIGSVERSPVLPDVPSTNDFYPGLTMMNWYAAFGPAGMAPALIEAINAAMARAIRAETIAERLRAQGISPNAGPAATFAREVEAEVATWARVAQQAGIRPE